MPRELVTVQVGQCGNQVGCRFWELALREHAAYNPAGLYDDALSSFFRNVDARHEPPINLPVAPGGGPIRTLKARAVVVDMEEGVIQSMLKGPLAELFDGQQLLYDVSGAGNNWAHGHHGYGAQYREPLLEQLRAAAEAADSLQGFLLLHSLGGGTGSGLGTYLLRLMQEEFPDVFRFSAPVFPSADDDVVTSPYNATLAAAQLVGAASCVLPVENAALQGIAARLAARGGGAAPAPGASAAPGRGGGAASWDAVNGIAASLLLHLTSSVRFEGSLNTDLNDITMNLVPFPRMHFLLSSLAPLAAPRDLAARAAPRGVDQLFSDAFSRESQLLSADPRAHTSLATALMLRGALSLSDANRNLARLRPGLRMAHWNTEGFKLGHCAAPPVGLPYSLLCLSNNAGIGGTFASLLARFHKLHSRRLFQHHYTEYMDPGGFDEAATCLADLVDDYAAADGAPPPPVTRLRPRGTGFL
ncbi:Tube1 [Scenedesmus sp. PABB004]|nr:Tube1 [Scenedesmus sp. PABB004]